MLFRSGGDLFLPSDEEESGAGVGGLDDDSDADEVSRIQFTPLLESNNACHGSIRDAHP